jgi:hypothetical protein
MVAELVAVSSLTVPSNFRGAGDEGDKRQYRGKRAVIPRSCYFAARRPDKNRIAPGSIKRE